MFSGRRVKKERNPQKISISFKKDGENEKFFLC